MTDEEIRELLQEALDALALKSQEIAVHRRYYSGDHPRVWMTKKLRKMFKNKLADQFMENWCELAVEAVVKELGVASFSGSGEDQAKQIFEENHLDLEQTDLYRDQEVAGEGFLFASYGEDDSRDVDLVDPAYVYWPPGSVRNDPEFVVYFVPSFSDKHWRAYVYDRRMVTTYKGPKVQQWGEDVTLPSQAAAFAEDPEFGPYLHRFVKVPVVRFSDRRGKPVSRLDSLEPVQDRINKLESQKMVAAESAAYEALLLLTKQDIRDGDLEIRAGQAQVLDPGNTSDGDAPTSVVQLTATPLENYDNSIEREILKFFTLASLPKHMFTGVASGVSGDTIEADRSEFLDMIKGKKRHIAASFSDLMDLFGLDVEPQFEMSGGGLPESVASTVKTYVDAGVPLEWVLKHVAKIDEKDLEELTELLESRKAPSESDQLDLEMKRTQLATQQQLNAFRQGVIPGGDE